MSKRLSGACFKLVTQRGDDLGILMVPEGVAQHLEGKIYPWTGCEVTRTSVVDFHPSDDRLTVSSERRFHLVLYRDYRYESAVFLVGISPEKLSQEPGFAFLPSAHYMRCTHTDIQTGEPCLPPKVEEPVVEPPDPYLTAAREFSA